ELDRPRPPSGHVVRELLEHRDGALPPPVAERVRDVCAQAPGARPDRVQAAHAEQVADVGDDPRVARLDEPVLVEALDVALDDVRLALEHFEQRLEGTAALDVAHAVERREELVELVVHDAVTATSFGESVSSWAGTI